MNVPWRSSTTFERPSTPLTPINSLSLYSTPETDEPSPARAAMERPRLPDPRLLEQAIKDTYGRPSPQPRRPTAPISFRVRGGRSNAPTFNQRTAQWIEMAEPSHTSTRAGPSRGNRRYNDNHPRNFASPQVDMTITAPGAVPEMKFLVKNLPPGFDTLDIWHVLSRLGNISRIDIPHPRPNEHTNAYVNFSPKPRDLSFLSNGMDLTHGGRVTNYHVKFERKLANPFMVQSPREPSRKFPEHMLVRASKLKFGVMETESSMLVLHEVHSGQGPIELCVNLQHKAVEFNFATVTSQTTEAGDRTGTQANRSSLKMRLPFAQMSNKVVQLENPENGDQAWMLSMEQPPSLYRKANETEMSSVHPPGAKEWNERTAWLRQTDIESGSPAQRESITQLQKPKALVDVARWLSYVIVLNKKTQASPAYQELRTALEHHNVFFETEKAIALKTGNRELLWAWLGSLPGYSDTSDISTCTDETIQLPFNILYQLEACISHGILHECNITKEFLQKLKKMENDRAVKLLEKVADEKGRFYSPEKDINSVLHKVSFTRKPVPSYCAMIRSATVTPTTIYFASAVLETSNRVIRKFQHLEDRFLRVKFLDEKYLGRVRSAGRNDMDEVYTRIKRTMTNGIKVGGRHYEYLAFGNSQFREHGAWFFAPTSDVTAEQIRERLGDFSKNKIVAKYCSRIGQCFSTTRATTTSVNTELIPDVERNGYCFTDGVGKISPFLAQMIANDLRLPDASTNFPSAFQFRREGCKGILVVDPSLKGLTIQTRPSQDKFAATQHRGLEIIRTSQFSAAYLNVQLILILSALGVEDTTFVNMMKTMLKDIQEAMTNEIKALELLQKHIDHNQMTLQVASMVLDGFMDTMDPFTISCLRLWRSWSLKYLKEKAKILVDSGAFVYGCVDETATLKGHYNQDPAVAGNEPDSHDIETLPEIFIQLDRTGEGDWKVLEGVCILSRNPSLHPGDVRVVRAVDVKVLHHIRNCVVLPQTGDRDLANMCSGGDLDGDDYMVIWEEKLLPKEWNHPPMDYTPPEPVLSTGKVTTDDMTSFFVTHMKHDNLPLIAVSHRYWADQLEDGVKDEKCLALAQLHSRAVDYAKTGVPAIMPEHLRVKAWPHWAERKGGSRKKIYRSQKIIGQLYDEVQSAPFRPAWELGFDQRILQAYQLDDEVKGAARDAKLAYDDVVRRLMSKYSIESEFEIWTTFVLNHSDDIGDFKFAEIIGEATSSLKDAHQKLCYERAGTNSIERDWSRMGPFIAAMYVVTAEEIKAALEECDEREDRGGESKPKRPPPTVENMPLMSFPWLFPSELGRIANSRENRRMSDQHAFQLPMKALAKRPVKKLLNVDLTLEPLEEISFSTGIADLIRPGEPQPPAASSPIRLQNAPEVTGLYASTRAHETYPKTTESSPTSDHVNSRHSLVDISAEQSEPSPTSSRTGSATSDLEQFMVSSSSSVSEPLTPSRPQLNVFQTSPLTSVPPAAAEPQSPVAPPMLEVMAAMADDSNKSATDRNNSGASRSAEQDRSSDESSDEEAEEVIINVKPSAVDALARFAES